MKISTLPRGRIAIEVAREIAAIPQYLSELLLELAFGIRLVLEEAGAGNPKASDPAKDSRLAPPNAPASVVRAFNFPPVPARPVGGQATDLLAGQAPRL